MPDVCEACGWMAAIASALAFGSFGVPIKSDAARSVDIDPLVFQSYKTTMCFLTSWFVLYSDPFSFSPWGIVSGLFWVPGGVATIYAIKSAGLAIGIGIGSSFIVMVSFVWGIFVFGEAVHSKIGACVAIVAMMGGLGGMSYFSAAATPSTSSEAGREGGETEVVPITASEEPTETPSRSSARRKSRFRDAPNVEYKGLANDESDGLVVDPEWTGAEPTTSPRDAVVDELAVEPDAEEGREDESGMFEDELSSEDGDSAEEPDLMYFCSIPFTKRQRGMLAAVFCGVWGGSVMAPMKWCKSDTQGTGYLISFAIGASLVTISLWIIRFFYNAVYYKSVVTAYYSLPSFHLRVMWKAGGLSGLLWSIGNFFSLISVLNLGEGVGYPLSQTSILISGLWGIFYFHEVTGKERIAKWLISSLLTIFGILLLSYEHHEK